MKIKNLDAFEILDSRGNPTVRAVVELENGIKASASVPSGASTGIHEALELRDNDPARYKGKGVAKAVQNIVGEIKNGIVGMEAENQEAIDNKMLEIDGTENKAKLGANAILGVSLATARSIAQSQNKELFQYIKELSGFSDRSELPCPTCNVINGGVHADSGIDFQEYMLIPQGIQPFSEKMRALSEIYQTLKAMLKEKGHITAVGDEGGFAPKLKSNEEPLIFLMESIKKAGYTPGSQISLGMDTAASEFFDKEKKRYILKLENKELTSDELLEYYVSLSERYPITILEDGMAEDDLSGWQKTKERLGEKLSVMGDDFTVTSPTRLAWALKNKALNSVLIKLNQIGTVTETLACVRLAYKNNAKISVSHRSGETGDCFLADFATGISANWIKSGSVARSERVEKYNRLIEIERML